MRSGLIALLLGLAAFALFATTAGQLVGYEPETAAVAEGLVKTGELRVIPTNGFKTTGLPGKGGHGYSRTGLAQPILEAPFYFVGEKLDDASSSGKNYTWRVAITRLFNPLMAALTVVAAFGLLRLRSRSTRTALAVAGLCAVASLAWPYAKIGMDTTLMATVAIALLGAAWAGAGGGPGRYAWAGIAAGVAITTKPYGLLLIAGVIPLLAAPLRSMDRERRTRAIACYLAPVLLGVVSVAWYNAYRTGSVSNFFHPNPTDLPNTPINALGLLLSPGKGLLFYSPLVVLGVLGLRDLWRGDRAFASTILLSVGINVLIIAATFVWSDDTWGPRYIAPTAWLLLLPLAWWARGARRRKVVAWVAGLAVCVQIVGVFAPYGATTQVIRSETGVLVFPIGLSGAGQTLAYGNDGPRWVPDVSPLLVQAEILVAWAKERLTGTGFVVSYNPTWGVRGRFDLKHPARALGTPLPDFWWTFPGESTALDALAAMIVLAGLGAGVALVSVVRRLPHGRATKLTLSQA